MVTCTATDLAGNAASAQGAYGVRYVFAGFDAPVDDGGVLNIARVGEVIPLAWRLTDAAGNPVTTVSGVTVGATTLSCGAGTSADDLEQYASSSSAGLLNLGNGYYRFNWKARKGYAGSCMTLNLNLGDGSRRLACPEECQRRQGGIAIFWVEGPGDGADSADGADWLGCAAQRPSAPSEKSAPSASCSSKTR